MKKNRRLLLQICFLALCLSGILLISNNTSIVSAKTTTLRDLKKQKKEDEELRNKGVGYSYYLDVYKCKGNVIRQDSYKSGNGIVLTTYYKLKSDGKTLKIICRIDKKSYFDEKTDTFKQKQSIKRANSSKYVKLSKKKLKKLEKKYKIIKAMWEKS